MEARYDGRRGLGIRPGPLPVLRLPSDECNDTDDISKYDDDSRLSPLSSPSERKSPTFRDFSLPVPSGRRGSASPTSPRSPSVGDFQSRLRRATLRPRHVEPSTEPPRGLYETQKLLSHLLDRLEERNVPPDILERAANQARNFAQVHQGKGKASTVLQLGQAVVGVASSGIGVGQGGTTRTLSTSDALRNDDLTERTSETEWSTDGTFGMVIQLRDLLLLARKQDLDLLHPRQSSSSAPDMSTRLLALLRSLSSADALYQISDFTPFIPPLALQTIWLDIATILYDGATVSLQLDIVHVVVDALESASDGIAERIYVWLSLRLGSMRPQVAGLQTSKPRRALATGASQPDFRLQAMFRNIWTAVCNKLELHKSSLTTVHHSHRLIQTLLTASPCPAHDLLHVAAYASPAARRIAVSLLSTYFPACMGHNTIARRPPTLTYEARWNKWETGQDRAYGEEDTGNHHYIHWRISSKGDPDQLGSSCTICEREIHGFCVRCTLCKDVLHLDCYQSAEGVFRYDVIDSDQPAASTTFVKFCRTLTTLDGRSTAGTAVSVPNSPYHHKLGEHDLHRVHLFTATPCQACREPIWADPLSVFACFNGCQAFFHAACIDDSPHMVDRICRPRQVWAVSYFEVDLERTNRSLPQVQDLIIDEADLTGYRYDEAAVLYGALWIRYQTLKNGITSRSLRILSCKSGSDPLAIRTVLRRYENFLKDNGSTASSAVTDFAYISGSAAPIGQGYLFSERYHEYIIALLRSPGSSNGGTESSGPTSPGRLEEEVNSMPLASARKTLEADLQITQDVPAMILLVHLRTGGYVRMDQVGPDPTLNFDLPYGIEQAPSVNTLIDCIAACLEDLNLAMNEQAMILLTNRAWPSLLCSPYNLERLAGATVRWVIAQDDVLHTLVRDYASKYRRLPGVRTVPGALTSRSFGPVQQYQESRNDILRHYVQPWLAALHQQDSELYAHILYEQCKFPDSDRVEQPAGDGALTASAIANLALDRLVAMADSGIMFSCLLDLLTLWLEDLGALADEDFVYKSLPRLLSRHTASAPGSGDPRDIFHLAVESASESMTGLIRACRWIRVLAFSSVEVPWHTIKTLATLSREPSVRKESTLDLLIAFETNTAPIDLAEYADLCGSLLVEFVQDLDRETETVNLKSADSEHVERLLVLVLRAHGVEGQYIFEPGGNSVNKGTGGRSVSNAAKAGRSRIPPDQKIHIEETIILAAARMLQLRAGPQPVLLDFLWLLFSQARRVSNIDETIYSLAEPLYKVLWPLLDSGGGSISPLRILLRLISINPNPLEHMLKVNLEGPKGKLTVERLGKLVIQLTDDQATIDCQNWRSNIVESLLLFFTAMSSPANIDSATWSLRQSLLPLHLSSLSRCFEDYLEGSSDERRLGLVIKLRKLRLSYPSWPVVSWDTIDIIITECVITIRQSSAAKASQNHLALLDSQTLRCNLISFGLDMLSAGIAISWPMALRFQQHVAALCDLPWSQPDDNIGSAVLPSLRDVLDSPAQLQPYSNSSDESSKAKTMPVGTLFIPIVIKFPGILGNLDLVTQRCVLDILHIVFHKHDTTVVQLTALDALQKVAKHLEEADGGDTQMLALAIVQAGLDRGRPDNLIRVMPAIFLSLAKCLMNCCSPSGHQPIRGQCAVLLKRIIQTFGRSGLLLDVILVELDEDAMIGKQATSISSEAILQLYPDTSTDTPVSTAPQVVQLMMRNLPEIFKKNRQALERCLSGLMRVTPVLATAMSADAIEAFGAFISKLGKHVADWPSSEYDPEYTIRSILPVLQAVKGEQAIPLTSQIATFLQLCLSRFDVHSGTLEALLALSRDLSTQLQADDLLYTATFSTATAAICGLSVNPITMASLLELCIRSQEDKREPIGIDCAYGLFRIMVRRHPSLDVSGTDPGTKRIILSRSSTLLLHLDTRYPGVLSSALAALPSEPVLTQLDVFGSLLLASTQNSIGSATQRLLNLLPVLARALELALRAMSDLLVLRDGAGEGAGLISAVLSAVRLAYLAAYPPDGYDLRKSLPGSPEKSWVEISHDEELNAFWMRISPEWYRLIYLTLEPSCINAPLKTVVHSTFLDTVISVARIWPNLAVEHAKDSESILDILGEEAVSKGKLRRARGIIDRGETPLDRMGASERMRMLEDIEQDLMAAERRS